MSDKLTHCRMVREQAKQAFKQKQTKYTTKRSPTNKTEVLRRNQCAAAAARYARDEYTKALEGAVNASEAEREVYAMKAVVGRERRDALATEVLRLKNELGMQVAYGEDAAYDTKQFIEALGIDMKTFREALMRWPTCAAL